MSNRKHKIVCYYGLCYTLVTGIGYPMVRTIMTSFVNLFNEHVEYLGVTNQKLAKVMDVHHTTIARWRREVKEGQKQNQPEEEEPIQRFANHYRLTEQELDGLLKAAGFQTHTDLDEQNIVNPFIAGQPVRYANFFGRQAILESLFSLWRGFPAQPIQNAAIIGDKRSGKTSLLMYLRDIINLDEQSDKLRQGQYQNWLPKQKVYNFIFVDFQDARLCNKRRLLSYILKNMQLNIENPDLLKLEHVDTDDVLAEFTDLVIDYLDKPTIILLDEFHAIASRCPQELDNNFWESLRSLSNNLYPQYLGFVLAANERPETIAEKLDKSKQFGVSPFFNIFGKTILLGALQRNEVEELITSSSPHFSASDIDFICEVTQCYPFSVQQACQMRLDALMFHQADWRKEVAKLYKVEAKSAEIEEV